jgi:uncharacterized membrane protein YfcA
VPVHRAVGTASALGFPIAIAGAAGYVQRGLSDTLLADGFLGFVYLPALGAIVLLSVLTAPLGVAAALRLPAGRLRRIFGALLLFVSARMFWSAI